MEHVVKESDDSLNLQNDAKQRCLPKRFKDNITSALQKRRDEKAAYALSMIFQHAEVDTEIVNSIQRKMVYLARIPKHLQPGIASGELTFMQKADTGESLGAIVGPDHMNRGFVRIEKGYVPNPNLLLSLSNLAMQQHLAQMALVLDEVRTRIKEIQDTLDHELFGELRGLRDQLEQISETKDSDSQKLLTLNAITALNITRGKITQRLIDEIKKMPNVPQNKYLRGWQTFWSKEFRKNVEGGYEKAQELFMYYLVATQLLAYAYSFLDEERSYQKVFVPDCELSQASAMQKLQAAEGILGATYEAWYKNPEQFLGRLSNEAKKLFANPQDAIEIEITGEQIMEAINNVQEQGAN